MRVTVVGTVRGTPTSLPKLPFRTSKVPRLIRLRIVVGVTPSRRAEALTESHSSSSEAVGVSSMGGYLRCRYG